jgi:Ca-activated chloride channel homolog
VLVKVRFKEPGASESDPAKEVAVSLGSDELASDASSSDADFRWSVAVAGFAEILKGSPYAPLEHLATVEELIGHEAYSEDADKQEFVTLFTRLRSQLE